MPWTMQDLTDAERDQMHDRVEAHLKAQKAAQQLARS